MLIIYMIMLCTLLFCPFAVDMCVSILSLYVHIFYSRRAMLPLTHYNTLPFSFTKEMKEAGCWPFICTTLLFLLFLAKFLVDRVWKDAAKLPPGTSGWAVIGDSINWYKSAASSHPPRFVQQQVQRYGTIFSCSLFGKRAIVSADANFNRFAMQNEGKLFQSSYPKSFTDLVGRNGVITTHGDQHRKLHSIASNMMRSDKLKSTFLKDIQTVLHSTLDRFNHDQTISLQDVCRKVAINLMVNQLLGVSNEAEVNDMAQLFSDFADGCLSIPINFPGFAFHAAMKARKSIISKINKTIEIHRQQPHPVAGNGLLWTLLEEESLADDVVADFIINLLFAGNETTAKTMLFAVYFLTHCPKAMNQLLDEHQMLKKSSSRPGENVMLAWQDYKDMPFTQCVIDETLRLGGIAIWLMREAKENIEYQDYMIPKGRFVVLFLSAIHLNEEIYKECQTFDPWRWTIPENQDKRNWRTSPFFTPYGGGARFCPGAELARLQVALFLHYFVSTFRWKQLREDRMSFFPSARLINGFQIQLRKISDEDAKKDSL